MKEKKASVKKPKTAQKEEVAATKKPAAALPAAMAKANPLEAFGSMFGGKPKPKGVAAPVAKPIRTPATTTPQAEKKAPPA